MEEYINIEEITVEKCFCGCGELKSKKSKYFSPACKTRVYRRIKKT